MMFSDNVKKCIYVCVILLLILAIIFSGVQILESTGFLKPHENEGATHSKTIIRNGVEYFPRQDITILMVLGIDQFGEVQSSGSYNNKGAADMVSLVIFDETNERCNILCLNRDTMLSMPVLGIGGQEAGEIYQQLALAHTYGSGLEDSCENTKKAVSGLLFDLEIDYYLSMNMDAIRVLNDAVGGVTVTVEDDFKDIDPTITMGQVTLSGDQAIHYVRTRKNMNDQTNLSRMERQKQYMNGFMKSFQKKQSESAQFIVNAYEDVSKYVVTDCSLDVLSEMLKDYADFEVADVISPEGTNVLDGEFYEFHLDDQKLDELILKLFYAPK